MAKDVILAADLGGEVLSGDQMAAIPDFAAIRKEIWDKFPGAIVRKEYRAGEILMFVNDSATTEIYILSGDIEVFINSPVSHVETARGGGGGWLRGLTKITSYIKGTPNATVAKNERTH